MNENTTNNNLVKKRVLTQQEEASVARFKQKKIGRQADIFKTQRFGDSGALELLIEEDLNNQDKIDLLNANIMEATGSSDPHVGIKLLSNLGQAIIPKNATPPEMAKHLNTIAQSMQALAPQDNYEGQLVAQLVILHERAMDLLGRSMRTDRVDFANVYLNGASKLLARHHETLDTLLKYRRKGEQKVHVEHVHVNSGGQAIVGNVTSGVGIKPQIEEGPHAKV